MKFGSEIIINCPQEKAAALWADPQYFAEHQDGFLRKKLIEGEAGEVGAVSEIFFKQGKGEMKLTETVVANNLPHSFEAFYHHKHMDNTLITSFTKINDEQTRYAFEGEYVAVRGFMPKLMMYLVPSMFRKQPEKWMVNFKRFAERKAGA